MAGWAVSLLMHGLLLFSVSSVTWVLAGREDAGEERAVGIVAETGQSPVQTAVTPIEISASSAKVDAQPLSQMPRAQLPDIGGRPTPAADQPDSTVAIAIDIGAGTAAGETSWPDIKAVGITSAGTGVGDPNDPPPIRRAKQRGDGRFLQGIQEEDIYCVQGCFDQIEKILTHLKLPYKSIANDDVEKTMKKIGPGSVVLFNCDSKVLSREQAALVGRFVSKGGYLFTSDWGLEYVICQAMPGYVRTTRKTDQHESAIRPGRRAQDHPYLRNVFPADPNSARFRWKIDSQSMIVDPLKGVVTLVESEEVAREYGSGIVACAFHHGEGAVLHVIGHFEKQTDEKDDGFALQQLLVNFIVEKQKAKRALRR